MLKPVKNYHHLFNRRTCSQCKHWNETYSLQGGYKYAKMEHDGFACEREGGPEGDWTSIEPEWHVCDRFNWRDPMADTLEGK